MTDQKITFKSLELAEPLQQALSELGYETPSPIQAQAIPPLMEGRDLLGSAQTGTGKTAAFALPLLHRMLDDLYQPAERTARVLVLTPTRELAVQVGKSFAKYGRHTDITSTLVYGGVGARDQVKAMRPGVDVLVATPGRLLDLCQQGHIDLSETDFFVLDEADRMLDMGFLPDIKRIIQALPEERQSLFFSATLSPAITKLAESILVDPVDVRIEPDQTTAERLDHRVCFVSREDRQKLLLDMLFAQKKQGSDKRTLVFSRTKHGADKLARHLTKSKFKAGAIHGNKSQGQRLATLERFRKGQTHVLVATDVAARGIDIRGVNLVINFDLPDEAEAYVHRIGRTARGGDEGRAFSFCHEESLNELRDIERLLKAKIEVHADHEHHNERLAEKRKDAQFTRGKKSKGKKPGFKRGGKPKASGKPNAGGKPNSGGHRRRSGRRRPIASKS